MSPKSRGRPQGRGRPRPKRPVHGQVRELRLSDQVLRSAGEVARAESSLEAEVWASAWLGSAWVDAPLTSGEPEADLCSEVAGRVSGRPSPSGLAALAALRRLAPDSVQSELDRTHAELVQRFPVPSWRDAPAPVASAAWRAVDVWGSERVLFLDYADDGSDVSRPHTLLAIVNTVGGLLVDKLALLELGAGARWAELREPGEVPMPLEPAAVDEVLAELAEALHITARTWPRPDDEDVVELRALAWARCRTHLPPVDLDALTAAEEVARTQAAARVDEFMALEPVGEHLPQDVVRSLADLCTDYGLGYVHGGLLAWSPLHVMLFLTDWLPRMAVLDAAQREALPAVLKAWLEFALARGGVAAEWIAPVVAAVDEHLDVFAEAFDDVRAWGPAKQVLAELAAGGVDLTDRDAVEQGVRQLNAQRLAGMLIEPDR